MIPASAHDRHLHDPPPAPRCRPRAGGLLRDEEIDLAARIAEGDREARDEMVLTNLGLVPTIARHFLGRGLEIDDLVGEGRLGLFRAAEKFEPRHGVRFSTYAAYWIKAAIRAALIDTTPAIRLPAHKVRLLTKWRRAERALSRELRRAPSFEEVASSLGLSEEQRRLMARAMEAGRLRTEAGYRHGSGTGILAEARGRRCATGPVEAEDERADILRRLGRLDDRERAILALRYGLEGEALTLREIGRRLGVTGEWAGKLLLRALRKLGEAEAPKG